MKRLAVPAFLAASLLALHAEDKSGPSFRETPPATKAAPAPTLREAVDALPEADLKEFLKILREHYVGGAKLTETEISRATVQGLLDRIAPGASLVVPNAQTPDEQSPFRSEIIENKAGYLRLGALSADHLGELDAALQIIAARTLSAAVLDLRATPPGSEFALAAKICERFCPKGRVLFTVKRPNAGQEMILTSKEDPRFKGVLVVLVDSDTAGAAEVIAAVLRTQAKALVIGQNTKGEAVEFSEVPLPSRPRMRIAVAEVALPENVSVFPGGVKPDVSVDVSPAATTAVLKAALDGGVAPLVVETERPRLNEAALVAGTNPELDAIQAAARAKGEKAKAGLRDAVLQRALDAITTIGLFDSAGKKPAN